MNNELRIIISGGGTGGHIFPAVSIANAIKAKRPDAKILFVGALGRMEMQRVPAAGYEIKGLPICGFDRKHLLKNIAVLFKIWKSQSRAAYFNGLPEMPVSNIHIKDMEVNNAEYGIVINRTDGVKLENIKVSAKNHTFDAKNSKNVTVNDKTYKKTVELVNEAIYQVHNFGCVLARKRINRLNEILLLQLFYVLFFLTA